jgi:hypothetical protein
MPEMVRWKMIFEADMSRIATGFGDAIVGRPGWRPGRTCGFLATLIPGWI